MKHLRISVICFLLAIATAICWYALSEAQEPGVVQFVLRTPDTVKIPPSCLVENGTTGTCKVDFVRRFQVQIREPVWSYGDVWTTWQGNIYHAHVWRLKWGSYYLWFWEGSRVWYAKAKYWVAHTAGIGPILPLPLVGGHASCPQAAPVFAVNVTTDAGTLQQPSPVRYCNQPSAPTDAGVADSCYTVQPKWPDGSVAKCNGKYWLMRNRYGGSPMIQWSDVDAGPGQAYQGPDPGSGASSPMEADAATSKTCPNVPVETPCP